MKSFIFFTLMVFLPVCLASPASARVQLHPHLMLVEEYTDNLFLEAEQEKTDWISTVEPGIALAYDSSWLTAELDYYLRFRFYEKHREEDESSVRDVQRAGATAVLFPLHNFQIFSDGEISRVAIDERGPDPLESEFVNTTNLYRYSLKPQYRWRITKKLTLIPGYSFERSDYDEKEGDDVDEQAYDLSLESTLTSTSELTVRSSFLTHEADYSRDFDRIDAGFGLAQRFGAKMTASAFLSYIQIDFDEGGDDDWIGLSLAIDYLFSKVLTLEAEYVRDYTSSVTRGLTKSESSHLLLRRVGVSEFEGRVFAENEEFLEEETRDRAVGAAFHFRIPVYDQLYLRWSGEYRYLEYRPEDEQSDRYSAGVRFGYVNQGLEVAISYTHRGNESNIDVNDYRNNLVMLLGSLRY